MTTPTKPIIEKLTTSTPNKAETNTPELISAVEKPDLISDGDSDDQNNVKDHDEEAEVSENPGEDLALLKAEVSKNFASLLEDLDSINLR